ncbi:MAG TPA: DUF169 domain-containing protein [Methanothrix sp.]|nr:DUF169 domain-containing protein [Methanothrix sp.]
MDIVLRDRFTALWQKYFPRTELPITLEFRKDSSEVQKVPPPEGWSCLICQLNRVRKGTPLVFDAHSISCPGGRMYSGYSAERSPDFRYFLSRGKPGVLEGERFKQTPEIVDAWEEKIPQISSAGKNMHFTRWDQLMEADAPQVVIFFARPEVLSGLFTLANFDQSDPNGVICPMGAGCSSIILRPWLEEQKDEAKNGPKVVLGMFDPSARPCVPLDVLTMAFPMKKFEKAVGYMEESFLTTKTWTKVQKKIERSGALHRKG